MEYKEKIDYDDSLFIGYQKGVKLFYVIPRSISSVIIILIGIIISGYCFLTDNNFFGTILLVFSAILAVFFALVIWNENKKNKIRLNVLRESLEFTIYFFLDHIIIYKKGISVEYKYNEIKYKDKDGYLLLLVDSVLYPIKSSESILNLIKKG